MKAIRLLGISLEKILAEADIDTSGLRQFIKRAEPAHGDYTSEVAMTIAKKQRGNPLLLATKVADRLRIWLGDSASSVEVAKPGFINIRVSDKMLLQNLAEILEKKQDYCSRFVTDLRIHIVEYSSPNIAKPFTIGHLRSTIIGDSIANILAHAGYQVIRDNHLGDWGTQFGKMIVALKKWGDIEQIQRSDNPVKELVELYQKFHQESKKEKEAGKDTLITQAREWFVHLENGTSEARRLWKFCVECSMKAFEQIYARLGVRFDTYRGESFFEDKMHFVFEDIETKGIARISEGALAIFFPGDILPPLLIRKSDGSTLYATRDLATDLYRRKTYGSDVVIINEVGKEQAQYFRQIFMAEEMLGYFRQNQRVHIKHGHYRFAEGKMSTREGNVIWLNEVLDEAVQKALALCNGDQRSAEIIAMGALKFNDLIRDPEPDITFSWEKILNMKGDSGPYVQYTAVRISSLIQKALSSGMEMPKDVTLLQLGKDDREMLRMLEGFFESLDSARQTYSTKQIADYLIKLCREYNKYYGAVSIISGRNTTGLAIATATREVLVLGLRLLGIGIPEKM